jgi:putative flippase GtrA
MISRNVRYEVLKYGLASGCALAIDVALLTFLIQVSGVHYLTAASASFTVGAIVAYLICIRYVFQHRRLSSAVHEFTLFVGVGAVGLAVNAAAMMAGVDMLQLHFLAAKLCSAGLTFATNFGMRKLLLFTPTRAQAAARMTTEERR